jgi:cytochrome c556
LNEKRSEFLEIFMTKRKHNHAFGAAILTTTVYLFLWGFQFSAWAGDASQARPLALRVIMQELGGNMQAITSAISQEQWAQVIELAPKVAAHPEPPLTEKMRILAYLGTDTAKFKSFDAQTHDAAHAMKQAATRGDGKAVIQSFARVQESCLGCHQAFRKSFVEYFYEAH